jgi:hypothetical protein
MDFFVNCQLLFLDWSLSKRPLLHRRKRHTLSPAISRLGGVWQRAEPIGRIDVLRSTCGGEAAMICQFALKELAGKNGCYLTYLTFKICQNHSKHRF